MHKDKLFKATSPLEHISRAHFTFVSICTLLKPVVQRMLTISTSLTISPHEQKEHGTACMQWERLMGVATMENKD